MNNELGRKLKAVMTCLWHCTSICEVMLCYRISLKLFYKKIHHFKFAELRCLRFKFLRESERHVIAVFVKISVYCIIFVNTSNTVSRVSDAMLNGYQTSLLANRGACRTHGRVIKLGPGPHAAITYSQMSNDSIIFPSTL
jgi:hypothetical protein